MVAKKRKEIEQKNKSFWMVFGIIVIISVVGIITSTINDSNLTGNAAYQTISFAKADSQLSFEVRNTPPLYEATIPFVEDVKNGLIDFKEIDTVSWEFEGIAISHLMISSEEANKFGPIQLTLKIKEQNLKNLGLKVEEVQTYFNGENLPTTLTKEEDGYVFYTLTSESLGEFVIGKKILPEEVVVIKDSKEPVEEEKKEESLHSEPEPQPLVGEAMGSDVTEEPGFFSKVSNFFKDIFN
ncbi:hypothetical protein HOC13_00720 [Candidatus Woesearchaeota archaeon]|jgi:hypothetical protein|nr:hypothetical protein [Candidatus Woesearchaeota archaeon]